MGIQVYLNPQFAKELQRFPIKDQEKIANFILHIRNYGFVGLAGRNKNSDEVDKDDPEWLDKVTYAQKYNLWHYHIGIPKYDTTKGCGDWTSEYIIHYVMQENFVTLVDFNCHPPFKLPSKNYLEPTI